MRNGRPPRGEIDEQVLVPGLGLGSDEAASARDGQPFWADRLRGALAERSPEAPGIAAEALQACPSDPELLLLATLAALAALQPERALAFLKRYGKALFALAVGARAIGIA